LIVDTTAREITHRVNFDGWYEFDAVDNSGTRLYLIHHFAAQPERYEVAKYSFQTGQMQAPVVDKTGDLRVMAGNRVSTLPDARAIGVSALSPDLKRLLVAGRTGVLVIDAQGLKVVDRWAGTRAFRSLAFSPDGSSVYGLDGAGLARIDARTGQAGPSVASPI